MSVDSRVWTVQGFQNRALNLKPSTVNDFVLFPRPRSLRQTVVTTHAHYRSESPRKSVEILVHHVVNSWGRISAHSSCAEHKCGWEAENYVRSDFYQGRGSSICQPGLQEGRCRHEQESRRALRRGVGELDGHCREPQAVQNSRLVFEQKERPQGWSLLTSRLECS